MAPKTQSKLLDIIIKLADTKSPKLKFEIITDLCTSKEIEEFSILDNNKKLELINKFSKIKDQASERGRKFAQRGNKKSFAFPGFLTELKFSTVCSTCGDQLQGRPGWIWRQFDKNYFSYCALPECFPKEIKDVMLKNYQYLEWLQKINAKEKK